MKSTTLLYPIFYPFYPTYTKLNLYPYIFSHFKKFYPSLLLNKCTHKVWPLKESYLVTTFFKVIQCSYETFQNVAPNLHSVICSEINTASITKGYCKRKGVVISSCFLWKLLIFIVKRFTTYYIILCGL